MSYLKCEASAADLVMNLFISNPHERHPYHNLLHTIKVVSHTKEIAAFYQLSEPSICSLVLAAWFHDTGYLFGDADGFEQRSVVIMNSYLKTNPVDSAVSEQAGKCIEATSSGPLLTSLAEKIACDAVTYDYGTPFFRESVLFEKEEINNKAGELPGRLQAETLSMLQNHIYYTEYCQLNLSTGKLLNIEWLKSLQ